MRTRTMRLLAVVPIALVIAGCAGTTPRDLPSGLSDGVHSHEFIHDSSLICQYNCVGVSSTYTGEWVANRPKGQGEVVGGLALTELTCRGEFGIEPRPGSAPELPAYHGLLSEGGDEADARRYSVWAKGDVYVNKKLYFTGIFRNNFYFGESCMPWGEGVWTSTISGARMTGTLKMDIDRRTGEWSTSMLAGPCAIRRKDGAIFEGVCDAPSEHKHDGYIYLQSMEDSFRRDPFILATASGTFTEANGRRLSEAEARKKVAQYQQYLLDKKIAEQREAATAAQEAQQRRAEQAEQRARESAANREGALAILGAVAIGSATSGRNYTDAQRSALADAYVQDRVNAANGTASDNFSQAADSVKDELDRTSAAAATQSGSQAEPPRAANLQRAGVSSGHVRPAGPQRQPPAAQQPRTEQANNRPAQTTVAGLDARARNPGESAQRCVSAAAGSDGKITFTNNCGEKVFVIWCGDLKHSRQRCGDGPKGGFYTHSNNIDAGGEVTTHVSGQYRYAACKGSISFGNDGEYEDNANGGFRCLRR